MAAYIKFDGIDGECKDKGHEKWSDLHTYNQSVHKPGEGATGAARRRGTVVLDDLVCTKLVDKSSPKIAEAVLKGKIFPKVEIHATVSTTDSGREPYYVYELKNVMVTEHTISASKQGKPSESFRLNFEEVKVKYTEMDAQGAKKGDVAYGWDVEAGKPV